MAGHPDVAEISDLAEGLLPPSRTADLRRHLDECELCADVHASLEEIRELLGTLPGPPRMPADVAGRIDAALAAEALLNATAPEPTDAEPEDPASAASVSAPPSVPDGDDSARVSRETSALADRPAGHARTSTTGPGRKDRKRNGRRRIAALSAVFTAAALGFGSLLVSSLNDGKSPHDTAGGHQSASADTFAEGKLEGQVADLLTKSQKSEKSSRAPHSFGVESTPGTNKPNNVFADTVPDCVRQGLGRSDAALATEEGTYKGTEALLVVLPDASDATRVTVYIVDSTCVKDPSATAKVLLRQSYARP
jgi:anti-sigma factor RsiW